MNQAIMNGASTVNQERLLNNIPGSMTNTEKIITSETNKDHEVTKPIIQTLVSNPKPLQDQI